MSVATVRLDGMSLPVELGGTSRRGKLTIEPNGSLRLQAAADVSLDELSRFVASKRSWIYRKLAEKEALRLEPVTKELVDGEGFLYLGRNYRLRVLPQCEEVKLERGRLLVGRQDVSSDPEEIISWYVNRGAAWLRPRAKAWSIRTRTSTQSVEVADLGHRWGSALPDGRVRIHWATMQLPVSLVDYVLAHEFTHLLEPHHGPTFWATLARVMPDFQQRREQLATEGSKVWLGACERAKNG